MSELNHDEIRALCERFEPFHDALVEYDEVKPFVLAIRQLLQANEKLDQGLEATLKREDKLINEVEDLQKALNFSNDVKDAATGQYQSQQNIIERQIQEIEALEKESEQLKQQMAERVEAGFMEAYDTSVVITNCGAITRPAPKRLWQSSQAKKGLDDDI